MQFRESVHKWDFHLVPIRRFTASVTGLGGDFSFFSIIPFGRRVPSQRGQDWEILPYRNGLAWTRASPFI